MKEYSFWIPLTFQSIIQLWVCYARFFKISDTLVGVLHLTENRIVSTSFIFSNICMPVLHFHQVLSSTAPPTPQPIGSGYKYSIIFYSPIHTFEAPTVASFPLRFHWTLYPGNQIGRKYKRRYISHWISISNLRNMHEDFSYSGLGLGIFILTRT